ncbi:hypothetical protein V6N13_086018 [Hibiscus sabdariffa]
MVLPEEHAMPMREKKGLKMDLREMIALSILDPPSFRVFCSPNRRGYDNAEQEKGKQQSHAENDNKKTDQLVPSEPETFVWHRFFNGLLGERLASRTNTSLEKLKSLKSQDLSSFGAAIHKREDA